MKKMPFGEADFLVRVLTRDFGKIDILAKGARKTTSKLNPHLDMLNHVRIQFVKNGERMPTLTDAEIISGLGGWFSDAGTVSLAGRMLRTIDVVIMHGARDEKLFSMTLDFFSEARPEAHAVHFLRDFFRHEGHGDSLPPEHQEAIIRLWPDLKS